MISATEAKNKLAKVISEYEEIGRHVEAFMAVANDAVNVSVEKRLRTTRITLSAGTTREFSSLGQIPINFRKAFDLAILKLKELGYDASYGTHSEKDSRAISGGEDWESFDKDVVHVEITW